MARRQRVPHPVESEPNKQFQRSSALRLWPGISILQIHIFGKDLPGSQVSPALGPNPSPRRPCAAWAWLKAMAQPATCWPHTSHLKGAWKQAESELMAASAGVCLARTARFGNQSAKDPCFRRSLSTQTRAGKQSSLTDLQRLACQRLRLWSSGFLNPPSAHVHVATRQLLLKFKQFNMAVCSCKQLKCSVDSKHVCKPKSTKQCSA